MEKTTTTPVDDGCRFKTPSYRITRGWARESEPAVGNSGIALAVVWSVLSAWAAVDWADSCAEYPHMKHARVKTKCFAGIPASSLELDLYLRGNICNLQILGNLCMRLHDPISSAS